jgi:hypothetical protein
MYQLGVDADRVSARLSTIAGLDDGAAAKLKPDDTDAAL